VNSMAACRVGLMSASSGWMVATPVREKLIAAMTGNIVPLQGVNIFSTEFGGTNFSDFQIKLSCIEDMKRA